MSKARSSDEQDRVRSCGRFAALVRFAAPRPWMSHEKMVYFLMLTASAFRVCGFLEASIEHDFRVPWAFPFRCLLPVLLSCHHPFRFAGPLDLQFSVRDSAHLYAPSQFAIRMNTVNEDGPSLFTPRLSLGYRLTDRERRILAAAWNGYIRRACASPCARSRGCMFSRRHESTRKCPTQTGILPIIESGEAHL